MRKFALVLLLALALPAKPARAVDLRWDVLAGYNFGLGIRGEMLAPHLFKGLPLGLMLGFGYTRLDPGDSSAVRQVFINDATDGTPQKDGYFLDFRLDGIWYLQNELFSNFGIFFGLRHDMFRGSFHYVGGNEDFTISADDWGVGWGARGEVKLSRSLSLLGSVGLDIYPFSCLYGHDTTYCSNGPSTNPKDGYTWRDADRAVYQPRLVPSLMAGLSW